MLNGWRSGHVMWVMWLQSFDSVCVKIFGWDAIFEVGVARYKEKKRKQCLEIDIPYHHQVVEWSSTVVYNTYIYIFYLLYHCTTAYIHKLNCIDCIARKMIGIAYLDLDPPTTYRYRILDTYKKNMVSSTHQKVRIWPNVYGYKRRVKRFIYGYMFATLCHLSPKGGGSYCPSLAPSDYTTDSTSNTSVSDVECW